MHVLLGISHFVLLDVSSAGDNYSSPRLQGVVPKASYAFSVLAFENGAIVGCGETRAHHDFALYCSSRIASQALAK